MKVEELIKALEKQNKEDEVFFFFKTPDGSLCFTSNITIVSRGAVYDEYGKLIKGVLISRKDSK